MRTPLVDIRIPFPRRDGVIGYDTALRTTEFDVDEAPVGVRVDGVALRVVGRGADAVGYTPVATEDDASASFGAFLYRARADARRTGEAFAAPALPPPTPPTRLPTDRLERHDLGLLKSLEREVRDRSLVLVGTHLHAARRILPGIDVDLRRRSVTIRTDGRPGPSPDEDDLTVTTSFHDLDPVLKCQAVLGGGEILVVDRGTALREAEVTDVDDRVLRRLPRKAFGRRVPGFGGGLAGALLDLLDVDARSTPGNLRAVADHRDRSPRTAGAVLAEADRMSGLVSDDAGLGVVRRWAESLRDLAPDLAPPVPSP